MINKPKPPRGPRNLKAGGFTNGLWRLEERAARLAKLRADRDRAVDFQSEATKDYWAGMNRRFGRRI